MTYRLKFDRARYMLFDISPDEIEAKLGDFFILDEPRWQDFWVPVDGSFSDESDSGDTLRLPDISCWISDNLVLSEEAKNKLQDHLRPYGELLPVNVEGNRWWVLHVTKLTSDEAVDEERSERVIDESTYKDVKMLAFRDEAVKDLLLFKSEYNDYKSIYCNQAFKDLIEGLGLQGLLFDTGLASIF
jgi:hypothetical protein